MIQKNKDKGFTLVSLAIYIALMLIILGMLTAITVGYKRDIIEFTSNSTGASEYDKFNLYLIKEMEKTNNQIVDYTNNYIKFSANGMNFYKYEFENGAIKLIESKLENNTEVTVSSIKLAEVDECTFSITYEEQIVIHVNARLGARQREAKYTLAYSYNTSNYQSETTFKYVSGD